jgi:hypothetical protein
MSLSSLNISEERKKVIEKILKLLDLAESSNQIGEKETAKMMATRLMVKYQISEDEAKSSDDLCIKKENIGKKKLAIYYEVLLNNISKYNGVALLRSKDHNDFIEFIFVGKEEDIEIALFIFHSVLNQIKELSFEKKFINFWNVKQVNSYKKGLVFGISDNLRELSKEIIKFKQKEGLVAVDNNLVKFNNANEFLKKTYNTVSKRASVCMDVYFDTGYNDYKKINLKNPINKNNDLKNLL